MHDSQLSRMIELEAGDALAVGEDRWLGKLSQLAAVQESLQDVLLARLSQN
jgi:hypothetical protein